MQNSLSFKINKNGRKHTVCLLFFLMPGMVLSQAIGQRTVLFVCEHGSAKSIVAASHFKRLAKQEGLDVKVISRGTNPDKAVPEKVNQFLVQDGFERYSGIPQKLSAKDIETADYIVAFSPLPATMERPDNIEKWNIPSFEAGYPVARDSMLINIERMIKRIKSDVQK